MKTWNRFAALTRVRRSYLQKAARRLRARRLDRARALEHAYLREIVAAAIALPQVFRPLRFDDSPDLERIARSLAEWKLTQSTLLRATDVLRAARAGRLGEKNDYALRQLLELVYSVEVTAERLMFRIDCQTGGESVWHNSVDAAISDVSVLARDLRLCCAAMIANMHASGDERAEIDLSGRPQAG